MVCRWNQLSNKTREMGDLTSFKLANVVGYNFLLCFYLISLMTHFLLLFCVSNYYYFLLVLLVLFTIQNKIVTFMRIDRNRYNCQFLC